MSSVFKIEEIGKVLTGKTPKTSESEFWDGVLPFYTPSDMDGRRRLDEVKRYITEDGLKTVKNSAIPPNSVMVSCIGSDMGKVSLSVKYGVTNQQINTIIPNEDVVDHLYLYYSLLPRKSELQLLASGGSAQPILNKGQFSKLKVVVPPLKDQKAITHILGTLDDKIELNQKMNQTLEEIAKAIFKSWFVDFDPVRAKAEGLSTRLPPEISDLFPDELVDSEIGEIPEGWGIGNLKSVSSNRSKSVKPDQMANFSSYVGLEHLPRGHIFLSNWGNPSEVESNKTVFEQGDILFGKLRPYFEKSVIAPTDGVCSTDIVAIEPNANTQIFVACLVSQRRFFEFTSQGSTGTRMPRTSWKHMCEFEFAVPSDQLLQQFQSMISPLVERAMIGISESETLSELRDTLLPKLISGELRIPDAEKFLEEAGI